MPSVEAVRPAACPVCSRAGRPVGAAMGIHGHGCRDRQQRGPMAPTARPEEVVVRVRRYLCRCGATITVTPSETQSRRLYTASAVGAALALFGVERLGASAVRAATSTWQVVGAAAVTGWATLRRWIAAVRAGRLFGGSVRAAPPDFAVRQVAERAAMTLAALGPPSQDEAGVVERAFRGAALAS